MRGDEPACPALPDDARAVIAQVIASARNEWLRATHRLVVEDLQPATDADQDDAPGEPMEDAAA